MWLWLSINQPREMVDDGRWTSQLQQLDLSFILWMWTEGVHDFWPSSPYKPVTQQWRYLSHTANTGQIAMVGCQDFIGNWGALINQGTTKLSNHHGKTSWVLTLNSHSIHANWLKTIMGCRPMELFEDGSIRRLLGRGSTAGVEWLRIQLGGADGVVRVGGSACQYTSNSANNH